MSIGTVGNLSLGSVVNCTSEKKPGEEVKLLGSTTEVFTQLLKGNEITSLIWSYLTPKEVGAAFLVSKLWKKATGSDPLWATFHKRAFSSENKVPLPSTLMAGESEILKEVCKRRYLETQGLFLNKMGVEFYSEYLGDVKTPPIPLAFINRAKEVDPFDLQGRLVKDTHRLVYVPKEITIKLPADSSLILKEGLLVEDLKLVIQEERIIIVPVTINNLSMLTSKCLKKGHAIGIHDYSGKKVLEERGNKPTEPHWSYQRRDIVDLNTPYQDQIIRARDNRYEVPSLIDRVLLNLLTYMSSRAFVDHTNAARTSTFVVGHRKAYQVVSQALDSRLSLQRLLNDGIDDVGVALGVPSESSVV